MSAPDRDGFSVIFVFLDAGGLAPTKAKRAKSAEKTRCQACLPLSSDGMVLIAVQHSSPKWSALF
ncbi:hypothetical protein [Dysosmobacter sp.]|uniref:hypothetical protein n=1 Tax=Dysosmobacter sp. TaxID=2591382 RepID=UPI00406DB27D